MSAIVVSDTSPIRALHHLGLLQTVPALFDAVHVPPAVSTELNRPTSRFGPLDVTEFAGILVTTPRDTNRVRQLAQTLDAGESEAIALAVELQADALLIDELAGRTAAAELGLNVTDVLGLLVLAKSRGLIGPVQPLIKRLRDEIDFPVSDALVREVLKSAGE